MFKAIGLLISLWAISLYFGSSIKAMDRAITETFKTIEMTAVVGQAELSSKTSLHK